MYTVENRRHCSTQY